MRANLDNFSFKVGNRQALCALLLRAYTLMAPTWRDECVRRG